MTTPAPTFVYPAGVILSGASKMRSRRIFPVALFDTQKILRLASLAQNDTVVAGYYNTKR